jgi:uncharacterized protein YaaQ
MKLIIAIIHEKDTRRVNDALHDAHLPFTKVASTGGFLREGNVTFMIGIEAAKVETVLDVLRESCQTREQYINVVPPAMEPVGTIIPNPVKVTVGGAIIFVLDVEHFEKV